MDSSADSDWLDGLRGSLREHERDRQAGASRPADPPAPDRAPEGPAARPGSPWAQAAGNAGPPPEEVPALERYELGERLGEGTTAVIFRAWDRTLHRQVALKILRFTSGLSSTARERFHREARISAGLRHPNLVLVHDAVEEKGRLYLVMELVDGRPLNELMVDPALSMEGRLRLLLGAARGLAEAHRQGIVHRDLKPSNILVTAAGEAKVADFGLAHLLDSKTELTRTGSTLGTPLYMSPEQVEGRAKEVTPRTDVYALGAILYEMVTGQPPFAGETTIEVLERIAREEPVPPRKRSPGLSRDLERIALKALSREPAGRYPMAQEFADDLDRYLRGEPIQGRPQGALRRLRYRAVRARGILIPSALALLVGGWVLLGIDRRGPPPGPAPLPVLGAPEYWVAPGGSDQSPGTRASPFREVERAIEFVGPGSTVHILEGSYRGGWTIRKSGTAGAPITFRAEGPGVQIGPAEGDTVVVTNSNHIVIRGLRILRSNRAAIRIQECTHIEVYDCTLSESAQASIWSGDSSDLLLEGNECSRGLVGFEHFRAGHQLILRRNRFQGNRASGIELDGEMMGARERIVRKVLIEENVLSDNGAVGGAAINCGGVAEGLIRNNLLYHNHATGIALYGPDQGGGAPSKNNVVCNNTVDQAPDGRWCVNLIGESSGNRIFNNILVTPHPRKGSLKYLRTSDLAGLTSDYNILTSNPHVASTEDDQSVQTLPEWQAMGFDRHSLVASRESLFVNPAAHDYHLRPDAAALGRATPGLGTTAAPSSDLERRPRVMDPGGDIGCFSGTSPVPPKDRR